MSDRAKISPSQIAILFIMSRIAPPAVTLQGAPLVGRDTWISELIAPLGALVFAGLMLSLAKRFPDQTLVSYTKRVFGKALGTGISLIYVWFFLHVASFNIRQLADVMTSLIPETPLIVFIASTLFVSTLLARAGIESLCRFGQMTFPLIAVLTFLVVAVASTQVRPENLLPIMERGPLPVMSGALIPLILFSELLPLGMLFPFLNRRRRAAKYMVIYIAVSGLSIALLAVMVAGIFGSLISELRFSGYYLARYISVADFLERLGGFAIAIWVFGYIVKITLFLYCAALALIQVLELDTFKPFVAPLSLFVALLSIVIGENIFELDEFFQPAVAVPYGLFIQFALPLATLVVASWRGHRPQPIPHGDESV